MFVPGRHIYLAAPFFNEQQRPLVDFFESFSDDKFPIYSPRLDGGVLSPTATRDEQIEIFDSNTAAIDAAEYVLAVVDDFDPGVIWEMGYAYAIGRATLAYTDIEGRGLNVMLAGSCDLGFISGRKAFTEFHQEAIVLGSDPFPRNTWRGEIQ